MGGARLILSYEKGYELSDRLFARVGWDRDGATAGGFALTGGEQEAGRGQAGGRSETRSRAAGGARSACGTVGHTTADEPETGAWSEARCADGGDRSESVRGRRNSRSDSGWTQGQSKARGTAVDGSR